MRFGLRTLGMITGLIGATIALAIDILYNLAHVLAVVTRVSHSTSHFWWGLVIVLASYAGSVVGLFNGQVGAVILVVCAIGLIFVVGWWALFASPFLLLAAVLLYLGRSEQTQTVAAS